MLITRIVIVLALLSLGACASSPRYVAADSATDYGHFSRKISENRYRVNFNGDRGTDLQEARDFALLRAAELTLLQGYEWFQIVDRESIVVETREPRAGWSYQRGYTTYRSCGLLGCSRTVQPATYATMRVDSTHRRAAQTHSLEILMGKGTPPADGNYYVAQDLVSTLNESM